MIHHLQHIVDLVAICRLKGIQQIVVSPGSRNAGLIKLFSENKFKLHSIVDERSAAFYALGIALATKKPVAIICTSGTASLNYGSALAEAYYQRVPIVAITADRPENLIDQQDNQTIRQKNVFQNYIKDSIHIKQPILNEMELRVQHSEINKILNTAITGLKGPVHINVPISEPFYADFPQKSKSIETSCCEELPTKDIETLIKAFDNSRKTMIVCGENLPSTELNETINQLASKSVILAEPISNVKGKFIISEVDRLFMQIEAEESGKYKPDLLITFGGPVISKRLKLWLQQQKNIIHYRIAEDDDQIDTYQNRTSLIIGDPIDTLNSLTNVDSQSDNSFIKNWDSAHKKNIDSHSKAVNQAAFSDLKVFASLSDKLPKGTRLHLGNSSPVRYAQLFDLSKCEAVYSNRGVSGIDGCLSTAAGFASQSTNLNVVILGDLSFLYDSNGLWNNTLPSNLKIIVINNQGGGIFRLIPGPVEMDSFEEFMETKHPVDISKLTAAFGVDYFEASELELKNTYEQFWDSKNTALLEIKTPRLQNAGIYKKYIERIKKID